jgi:hypothetical protein
MSYQALRSEPIAILTGSTRLRQAFGAAGRMKKAKHRSLTAKYTNHTNNGRRHERQFFAFPVFANFAWFAVKNSGLLFLSCASRAVALAKAGPSCSSCQKCLV